MDPDYALFAAVFAHGSIAAGGRACGISAPMASKRIARLEARLGARLVHRTTRRLSLTAAGERFHAAVVEILSLVARAEAAVAGERGPPRGPLRMTAPTSFGRLHVAPYLKLFLDACPEVALTLDLSDGFVDLAAGRIDLAIRIAPEIPPTLVAHRLATSARILCAAPMYLAEHGVPETLEELATHRLLAAADQLPWRLIGPAGPATVEGRSHVATDSSEVVRELAITGVGIALRSLWDVAGALGEGRLVRVLPDHEGSAEVGIWAVHPRAPLVPASVRAMIAHLTDLYASPPWERR